MRLAWETGVCGRFGSGGDRTKIDPAASRVSTSMSTANDGASQTRVGKCQTH